VRDRSRVEQRGVASFGDAGDGVPLSWVFLRERPPFQAAVRIFPSMSAGNNLPLMNRPGLEPGTYGLKGCISIGT
jgi:hypothetical protein